MFYGDSARVQQTGTDKKNIFKEMSNGCTMYEPCPICFKCQNKASHLYIRCESCPLDFCGHNHKQRSLIIKRENFAVTVTDETGEEFLKLSENLKATEQCTCETKGDKQDEA
jgi:hypothetical protein